MKIRHLALFAVLVALASSVFAASAAGERADWSELFANAGVRGTLVIMDARESNDAKHNDAMWVHDPARAERRYSPASTFKIPHSLFALDAGILRDEFQRFPWDGLERPIAAWNKDQNLRSAMRSSTVWLFEQLASQLGAARETEYLKKIEYGNASASGKAPFWVEGDLAVSAMEQIRFLHRLYRNELPFDVAHQRLVKDVMVHEAGPDWILRAKTGWSGKIGWWVGWIEWPAGPVFFALNIDTPNRMGDLPKRQEIVLGALRAMDALPPGK